MPTHIEGKVRRSGNSVVVTIPKQTMIELGIKDGDYVGLEIQPMELRPTLPPDVRDALELEAERIRVPLPGRTSNRFG